MLFPVKSKKNFIKIILFTALAAVLVFQVWHLNNKSNIDTAEKKVRDLFEVQDEEEIQEGDSSKIKDSTDQAQIDEALNAVSKINASDDEQSEKYILAFTLQSSIVFAQQQLNERESTMKTTNDSAKDKQKENDFQSDEDDVVFKEGKLKNKNKLEDFMEVAGENGNDNDSEVRVVKDEGENGVLIYNLESNYDKKADQRWICVMPDLDHYKPPKDKTQDVFNRRQQCGYMSKDETEGYYKLNECHTHLEHRLLPTENHNKDQGVD